MIKASPITTKMFVALIIAIKTNADTNDHTGYKIKAFKFIAKRKQLEKNSLSFKS